LRFTGALTAMMLSPGVHRTKNANLIAVPFPKINFPR
jgi:hypothetical protein